MAILFETPTILFTNTDSGENSANTRPSHLEDSLLITLVDRMEDRQLITLSEIDDDERTKITNISSTKITNKNRRTRTRDQMGQMPEQLGQMVFSQGQEKKSEEQFTEPPGVGRTIYCVVYASIQIQIHPDIPK